MANDNETVEQACAEMMGWEHHTWMCSSDHEYIECLAKRCLAAYKRKIAAHKREIEEQAAVNEAQAAQLRDALNETEELKREVLAKDNERLIVAANYEAVIAAKDRIIAAKDAEIEDLKAKNAEAFKAVLNRDALVKELAGLVSDGLCHLDCIGCPLDEKCESKRRREIIAKARKVCK